MKEAFLRAITAEPDEDAHRLVYADWLDEHAGPEGQARAEFIRCQVGSARWPTDDPRTDSLLYRAKELLNQHRSEWLAELPTLKGVIWHRFWRGFVSGADVQEWRHYSRNAYALFDATPVQFLRVFDIGTPTCLELASSPYLARLIELELVTSNIGDKGVTAVANSQWLGNLRSLVILGPLAVATWLPAGRFGDEGALALANSPFLGRLEVLDVRYNLISPEAAEQLRRRFGAALRL
jgi:uncharacterized protein (TIGR02996 family)